jgi:hypothetical protein
VSLLPVIPGLTLAIGLPTLTARVGRPRTGRLVARALCAKPTMHPKDVSARSPGHGQASWSGAPRGRNRLP